MRGQWIFINPRQVQQLQEPTGEPHGIDDDNNNIVIYCNMKIVV